MPLTHRIIEKGEMYLRPAKDDSTGWSSECATEKLIEFRDGENVVHVPIALSLSLMQALDRRKTPRVKVPSP